MLDQIDDADDREWIVTEFLMQAELAASANGVDLRVSDIDLYGGGSYGYTLSSPCGTVRVSYSYMYDQIDVTFHEEGAGEDSWGCTRWNDASEVQAAINDALESLGLQVSVA